VNVLIVAISELLYGDERFRQVSLLERDDLRRGASSGYCLPRVRPVQWTWSGPFPNCGPDREAGPHRFDSVSSDHCSGTAAS
jgi:hypothetical protein